MRHRFVVAVAFVVVMAALLAFIPLAAQESGPRFSEWGPATPLGEPFTNVLNQQGCPFISKDDLNLYFRAALTMAGPFDIYVSHRESPDSSWETPVSLGPKINTAANEVCSFVTIDEHWLYFVSDRPGGYGGTDIWVSHRKDKKDPTGWETPVNLGPYVNTSNEEMSPSIFEDEASGKTIMYFARGTNVPMADNIFQTELLDRDNPGPPTAVAELNGSGNNSLLPFVRRKDGLEVFFTSWRPPSIGSSYMGLYIWTSTRLSTSSPWSKPVSLGPAVNSPMSYAMRSSLSWDGTTLYFWSNRTSAMRLYMSTRTQLKGKGK
jgi:hypothetical protein